MKATSLLITMLTGSLMILSGCGKKYDLKEDATKIGDAMCKSIEVMNQLKAANPDDSVLVMKLRSDESKIQADMAVLYEEFNKKWGDKTKKEDFTKEFGRELRKAMLDCKSLSREDRENFMKEIGE
jgi:hypothetical protein